MAGITLQTVPNSSRVHRRPRHKFLIDSQPMCFTPFMIAAVWPGESMVNAFFEAREVSPPLTSSLMGWGSEWYLFYVKMSDLVDNPEVMGMLIDPNNTPLAGSTASARHYYAGEGPNYLDMCVKRIVKVYFRDSEETLTGGTDAAWNSEYKVKYRDFGFYDSLTPGAFDDGSAVPPAASGMDDLARAQDLYDYLVAAQLTDLSYSDWCAAYGVKIPTAEKNEPEFLTKWTEWSYPSNTIDPVTGTPSSALSMVVKYNFNEPRYFKEPGFLVGGHVLRPKIYIQDQKQGGISYLNTALAWLPAMLASDPSTSLREFGGDEIITGGSSATKYILDMRDLPVYGDQFTNVATVATDPQFQSMDLANNNQYPSNVDLTSLFKTPANPMIRADGFISLDIVGRIVDYTTAHTSTL